MTDYINNGVVNLSELSKFNGKPEIENAKTIVKILATKAYYYDICQKALFTYQEQKKELR